MDTAKQVHIAAGRPWTQQLQQAANQAKRACQRGRGPAKQAQPLPLLELGKLEDTKESWAPEGPAFPVRSTIIISWWLLREIEASLAEISHVDIDPVNKVAHWRLPSSKADWKALGAVRTHACACDELSTTKVCPFHCIQSQRNWAQSIRSQWLFPSPQGSSPTKLGWATSFEAIATRLGLEINSPTGFKLFTGHSARATGAVYLAQSQTELWRIQLFGRWGSECFLRYVRDAPLTQLQSLAKEATLRHSLAAAKAELSSLLKAARDHTQEAYALPIQQQPAAILMDCEASAPLDEPVGQPSATQYVVNRSTRGKVHKVASHATDLEHFRWRTLCGWYFTRHQVDYSLISDLDESLPECAKCFNHPKQSKESEASSSDSSSESSSASQVG